MQETEDNQQKFFKETEELLRPRQAREAEKITRQCVADQMISHYTDTPLSQSLLRGKSLCALFGVFKGCVRM